MKQHRHLLLPFVLLFLVLGLIVRQSAIAEQSPNGKTGEKGLISFELPWRIEAKVEVNLTAKLINLVSKSVSDVPEVTDLIQMLDGIYVRTYDRRIVDEQELVDYFQQKLKSDKWEVLFKINEDDETVEINLLFDENTVYGIFVIVIPKVPEEVTFVNIIGKIAPERVEDLLRNLSNFGAMDINVSGKLKAQAAPIGKTVQRELLAVKIDYPPKIDGILDDACWKIAPHADGFTHISTKKPVADDSVIKLVYTSKAIYVGCHLHDSQPDKIVAHQTKDQVRFDKAIEDWVSFSIDPFHRHQFAGRTFFMVNPLGAKYVGVPIPSEDRERVKHIDETLHLWSAAAKIVEDGWVVELEIPWAMLDYPETTEPIQMGINFDRLQARTEEHSWWSNLGPGERHKDDGHWLHVLPPPKSPDGQGSLPPETSSFQLVEINPSYESVISMVRLNR